MVRRIIAASAIACLAVVGTATLASADPWPQPENGPHQEYAPHQEHGPQPGPQQEHDTESRSGGSPLGGQLGSLLGGGSGGGPLSGILGSLLNGLRG
ncbi:hypothetical protein HS041_01665 [Planomonospora sp. ID67723]|uniref:hypothetical protein n=1 Tax=Planomonospora sp. ID67723 TaxID=2738134 RepID=UPI0018C40BFB|nr:hypothetical protein [Planomonospora sp. ID67723]MBG0826491.1 hypothetical protein [Planomonospora sp. ID67723]